MNHKEFIQNHPIELALPYKEAKALREVLKKANESYVLEYTEKLGVKTDIQYYDFNIHCPTTNFARAYLHLGILYAEHVLPIWNERWNKKEKQ